LASLHDTTRSAASDMLCHNLHCVAKLQVYHAILSLHQSSA